MSCITLAMPKEMDFRLLPLLCMLWKCFTSRQQEGRQTEWALQPQRLSSCQALQKKVGMKMLAMHDSPHNDLPLHT